MQHLQIAALLFCRCHLTNCDAKRLYWNHSSSLCLRESRPSSKEVCCQFLKVASQRSSVLYFHCQHLAEDRKPPHAGRSQQHLRSSVV
eukprot:1987593-Amphidinium_carterae.1